MDFFNLNNIAIAGAVVLGLYLFVRFYVKPRSLRNMKLEHDEQHDLIIQEKATVRVRYTAGPSTFTLQYQFKTFGRTHKLETFTGNTNEQGVFHIRTMTDIKGKKAYTFKLIDQLSPGFTTPYLDVWLIQK